MGEEENERVQEGRKRTPGAWSPRSLSMVCVCVCVSVYVCVSGAIALGTTPPPLSFMPLKHPKYKYLRVFKF